MLNPPPLYVSFMPPRSRRGRVPRAGALALALLAVACQGAGDAPPPTDPTPPAEAQPSDGAQPDDGAMPSDGALADDPQLGNETPAADDPPPGDEPPAAQGTPPGDEAPAAQTPASDEAPAASDTPVDPIEADPVLTFARDNGFGGIFFALDCASVGADGEALDGEGLASLPVGGGRRLECQIDVSPRVTQTILDSGDEPWCQLGQLTGFRTNALDDRLTLQVESTPPDGPWFVVATHAGDEITIIRATGVWPLGIEIDYDTIDLRRADGRTCEEVFGLSPSPA